jgi:hypothetical protein
MHRTQIALCYGTRPQVIEPSALRSRLEIRYPVVAVDTGRRCIYEVACEAGGHPASLCDARRNGSKRSGGGAAAGTIPALEPLVY